MIFFSQHNGSIHILAVKASVQTWWPNTTIKLNLNVCDEHVLQKCSLKSPNTWKWKIYVFSHEQFYCWWMRHVAAVIFGFMLWQPWYKYSSALVLLTLGQGLLLHLLQQYAACLSLAHTESKIPIKLVLGLCHKICFITNATQASALTLILIIKHICKIVKSDY